MKTILILALLFIGNSAMACPYFSGLYVSQDSEGKISHYNIGQNDCSDVTFTSISNGSSSTETLVVDGKEIRKDVGDRTEFSKSEFAGDALVYSMKSFDKNPESGEMTLSFIVEVRMYFADSGLLNMDMNLTFMNDGQAQSITEKLVLKRARI